MGMHAYELRYPRHYLSLNKKSQMRKVVKCPQKWHVTDILLVASTPLGTFLLKKNNEQIYRPPQCGRMQFFQAGRLLGRPTSGRGEDERDTLRHVLSGGMSGTPKSAGQICRKFHFPNALAESQNNRSQNTNYKLIYSYKLSLTAIPCSPFRGN